MDVLGRPLWIDTPPEDKHDFKDEKDDGQFHLPPDETSELHPVIDPPGEDPGGDRKRRGNRTQDEEIETGGFKRGLFKEQVEHGEKGGGNQEGDGKVDHDGMGMASRHWESEQEILNEDRQMFQLFWGTFLENTHLGIPFKNLRAMGSRHDLSTEVLSRRMSVHMKTF